MVSERSRALRASYCLLVGDNISVLNLRGAQNLVPPKIFDFWGERRPSADLIGAPKELSSNGESGIGSRLNCSKLQVIPTFLMNARCPLIKWSGNQPCDPSAEREVRW